jgi:glycosyltransferase involved in cell wall biosynthesis/SAM-dependent methyltransferase
METTNHIEKGLVSVIIPSYNHGLFLPEAIASVNAQEYPKVEIVVVDDGSTDNTRSIAGQQPGITYIYQENHGLSAARNTGITHSRGEFLLFLDADDWLLPNAIQTNVEYLNANEKLAFVSGAHDKVYALNGMVKEEKVEVESDHYTELLQKNYIGMHATVLFRRWVFDQLQYDTSLRVCEDYDLYLKIARNFPVHHHSNRIAAYRLHTENMSGNIPLMLASVLLLLEKQRNHQLNDVQKKALRKGKTIWKDYYCKHLFNHVLSRKEAPSTAELTTLLKYKPAYFFKFIVSRNVALLKKTLKKNTPDLGFRLLHKLGVHNTYVPAQGSIRSSDFSRTSPISQDFGFERGGPLDRYYIENFLQRESADIKGSVLEIGDNTYTMRFGGNRILQSDILHINENNPAATIVADISNAPQIADNTFDCIILTQTLQMIYEFKDALKTCYRILKPGGTLLLTVPGISQIDRGEWKETWYWSFTDIAMKKAMSETFPGCTATVETYGNVFAASAFLYGVGLPEIPTSKLDIHDPHYQVIISVKAQKTSTI